MNEITKALAGWGLWGNLENTMQDTSIETLHKSDEFSYEAFSELTKEAYQECQKYISEHSQFSDKINHKISTKYELRKYERIGLVETTIAGEQALIRNDIDFSYLSDYKGESLTNYQRMERGLAPIDSQTGKPIELHHIGQYQDSPLAELTHEEHNDKNKLLHYELPSEVHSNEDAWHQRRKQHWMDRARIEREKIKQNQSLAEIQKKISGSAIVSEGSKIFLEKEINGKPHKIVTIDDTMKTIDVVVDVKTPRKDSVATGLTADDVHIHGYTVRQIHEVRGPHAWLLDTDSPGREIPTRQGKVFVKMALEERRLENGDIIRYNTWDFRPHALYEEQLSRDVISCESPEHKRDFILRLADDFCAGRTNLEDKFAPEIKEQLRKIHETRKAPAYLNGYEIHHDGYGNMFLLPKEIHCRKLSHIGGSWLMNTRNYAVYIESLSLDGSTCKVLTKELTAEKIKAYDNFTIEEKESFISTIGNRILCNTGLSDVKIEFTDNFKPRTCGTYEFREKKIVINRKLLENPFNAIHTELHEIRHAIQHDAVVNPEKYSFDTQMLDQWRNNMTCYIRPELDYEAYRSQPIETDAETWASTMLHGIKKDSLYV